jgi:hypothetical protein
MGLTGIGGHRARDDRRRIAEYSLSVLLGSEDVAASSHLDRGVGALLCGFIGRRSIRWWRHATVTMWVGLLELILAVGIAFVYVTQVSEASVVDLFEMKKTAGSR